MSSTADHPQQGSTETDKKSDEINSHQSQPQPQPQSQSTSQNADQDSISNSNSSVDSIPNPNPPSSTQSQPANPPEDDPAVPPLAAKPRPPRKRRVSSQPKGILKPSPQPQKTFSFRRDILQSLNSRLAQQGVNVQIPVPSGNPSIGGSGSGSGVASSNVIQSAGSLFRRIGGLAAGVVAPLEESSTAQGQAQAQAQNQVSDNGGNPNATDSSNADDNRVPNQNGTPTKPNHQATRADSKSSSHSQDSTITSPNQNQSNVNPTHSAEPLKRVQFTITSMSVTYPISNGIAPSDEDFTRIRIEREHRLKLKEWENKKWNVNELESLYRNLCRIREEMPLKKMRSVFSEASQSNPPVLRTMDLSFVPLDRHAIEPIADFLSVNFGLGKLVLENCNLVDETLKPLLHALLISGSLPTLSLASNRKIKFNGWRYIAIFMRRARALRYLDLSENTINKAALEQLVQAITKDEKSTLPSNSVEPVSSMNSSNSNPSTNEVNPQTKESSPSLKSNGKARQLDDELPTSTPDTSSALNQQSPPNSSASHLPSNSEEHFDDFDNEALMPSAPLLRSVSNSDSPPSSAIISLRLENCGLKTNSLDLLANGVRHSDLRHLSLRRNRIGQMGAVALATMLRDYPDSFSSNNGSSLINGNGAPSGVNGNGSNGIHHQVPPSANRSSTLSVNRSNQRPSLSSAPLSRTRHSTDDHPNSSPTLPDLPVITSSPAGGITSRRLPSENLERNERSFHLESSNGNDQNSTEMLSPLHELDRQLTPSEREEIKASAPSRMSEEEAISLYQAKRTKRLLKDLPRIGNLLTLDLKSNDLRNGVSSLSQVLKKNRTLRVLNLSDNGIEMNGLIHLAEALKVNSTLETLDISHNPCAGPGLEGITRLRTAFTLNSNLKRLFLNDTDLSSEGAIALAEFLPEAKSLIHLDLTENFAIDIAGVMALAVSVKMNQSLRCLDLNIPPNDPDFARLSQDILQSCVRNTEQAQRKALQRGSKQAIAAPIYKSVVARAAKEKDERTRAVQAAKAAEESAMKARREGRAQDAKELVREAEECNQVLMDLVRGEEERRKEKSKEGTDGDSDQGGKEGEKELAGEKNGKPDFVDDLVNQAKRLRERLINAVGGMQEGSVLDRALTLNDSLESVSSRLSNLYVSTPSIDTSSLEAAANQPSDNHLSVQVDTLEPPSPGLLGTPVIESSLSSPTFSIGSEEDEDEEDGAGTSSRSQDQSSVDQIGLGILPASNSDSIEIQAAREEIPLSVEGEGEVGKEDSESESKAKGQLSEEGELFKKAKSLGLDEEEDEEDEDDSNSKSNTGINDTSASSKSESNDAETSQQKGNLEPESSAEETSNKTSARSHSPNSSVSGEELRKDLLQTELPPSTTSSSSSTTTKTTTTATTATASSAEEAES